MPAKPVKSTRRPNRSGGVRRLPSGRWQATFPGPDGVTRPAPETFDTKGYPETWLARQADEVKRGTWAPPERHRTDTLKTYAEAWLAGRNLKPRTRDHYRKLLDGFILPLLGDLKLDQLQPARVRSWFAAMDPTKPTMRGHAYGLLRTICGTAVSDDIISANPCRIPGGGSTKRKITIRPATLAELEAITDSMPERLAMIVVLAAWCAPRFGELTELRRKDVDLDGEVLRIRRAVVRVKGQVIVGTPKSEAGIRDVAIPPHLISPLRAHLREHTGKGDDALLFPGAKGGHLAPSALYGPYYRARDDAGRPDLRFHDLRHTGAVLAAQQGATIADLMGRLGHSTPGAAMRYQHASADRDRELAARLSALAAKG